MMLTLSSRRPSISGREPWNLDEHKPLEPDELLRTIAEYKRSGCTRSCNRVVESHLRLVAKIARRFAGPTIPVDDLMVEGALALRRALDNFDPKHGVSFTSYASVVVAHAVRGAARTHHDHLRVPSRERRRAAVTQRSESVFYLRTGRRPTRSDDAEPPAPRSKRGSSVTLPAPQSCVSLDAELGRGRLHATTLADDGPTPLEAAARADEMTRLMDAINSLSPQTARALSLRFGMEGELPMPIPDIARVMRVSPMVVTRTLSHGLVQLRRALEESSGSRAPAGP